MRNIFTVAYTEEEANEIGYFIMSKGYEGVQNDSYRYCREHIRYAFNDNKVHDRDCVFVGVSGCQMIVAKSKRTLRRKGLKYIEKKRVFYDSLESEMEIRERYRKAEELKNDKTAARQLQRACCEGNNLTTWVKTCDGFIKQEINLTMRLKNHLVSALQDFLRIEEDIEKL